MNANESAKQFVQALQIVGEDIWCLNGMHRQQRQRSATATQSKVQFELASSVSPLLGSHTRENSPEGFGIGTRNPASESQ